jgi:kynurenine formamidase
MTLIDLSHPLIDGQPCYPGDPPPEIKPFNLLAEAGFNTTRLSMGTHQGTHLDAPFHFFRDGMTVDRIPLETLYGPAELADLAPGGRLGQGAAISRQMLEAHGQSFYEGARVIYRTGWDQHFGREEFYQSFPSLTPDAARWMVDQGIRLAGMDTPSPAEDYEEVHQILLGAGVIIVEALANLGSLPQRFTLAAFPLRFEGRDGSPVRAVGIVD